MSSFCESDCRMHFQRARYQIDKSEHCHFRDFRSRLFVAVPSPDRAIYLSTFDKLDTAFRNIRKNPEHLFQVTPCSTTSCQNYPLVTRTHNQLSDIADYVRRYSDSHTLSCYNCTLYIVNECLRYIMEDFHPEEARFTLYYLKEYVAFFHHDVLTSTNFPMHNCKGDGQAIQESHWESSALLSFLWRRPWPVPIEQSRFSDEGYYEPEESDDESLPSEEGEAVMPQSGFSKIFYVNLYRNCLTDIKSVACRNSFVTLLNIRASSISETGDVLRKILHTSFHPRDHTRIMTKFHDALQYHSRINAPNARRFAAAIFEPLMPELFGINLIPNDINFTLQLPAIELLTTKLGEIANRIGVSSTKISLILRICWFFYDIARGERVSIAILRLVSAGFDAILAQLLINQATGLFATLSDQTARFFGNTQEVGPIVPEAGDTNLVVQLTSFLMKAFLGRDDPEVDIRLKNMATHEKAKLIRSCSTISEFYGKLFTTAFTFIRDFLLTEKQQLDSLEVNIPKVARWIRSVDELDDGKDMLAIPDLARVDCTMRNKIFTLKSEADGWVDTLSKLHANQPFWQIFMEKYRRFNRIYEIVRANGNYTARQAPFVFILQGKPGVGKSLMVNNLNSALYRVRGEKFVPAQDTFMRAASSPYWDGYGSQKVLYYNDIFQTTDATINQSVAMELISCAQVVPMPLNCARIEKKDNMFFSSEIVVADCNIFPTDTMLKSLITEPDALRRRFAFQIEVNLKPEWSINGKFDTRRATRPFEYDAYEFKVIETNRNEITLCNWKELIRKLSKAWAVHRGVQRRNVTEDDCGIDADFIAAYNDEFTWEAPPYVENLEVQVGPSAYYSPYRNEFGELYEDGDDTVTFTAGDGEEPSWWITQKFREIYVYSYNKFHSSINFFQILALLASIKLKTKTAADQFLLSARQQIRRTQKFLNRHRVMFAIVGCAAALGTLVVFAKKLWAMAFPAPAGLPEGHYPGDQARGFRKKARNTTNLEGSASVGIPKEYRYLDHDHIGLPTVGRTEHTHACVNPKCGAEFKHTHKKRTKEESLAYPHLCTKCRKNGVLETEVSRFGAAECAMTKMAKNQYNITNDRAGVTLNGWFLKGNLFVMPNHFFEHARDTDEIRFVGVHRTFTVLMSELENYRVEKSKDLRIIAVPRKRCVNHTDISNFLQSSQAKIPSNASVFVPSSFDGQGMNLIRHMVHDLREAKGLTWGDNAGEISEHVKNGLAYRSDTRPGDCGSLVVILDATNTPRIVGMHMAGSLGTGVAGHITKEIIERLTADLQPEFLCVEHPLMGDLEDAPENLGPGTPLCVTDNIEIIGTLPPSLVLRTNTQTRITPSLLYDTFKPITAPAMLRMTAGVDPLRNGVKKMARQNVDMDTEILQLATEIVKRNLFALDSEHKERPRNLTREESVNGIVGDKHIRPVNMRTSPGWPYKLTCKSEGKTDLIKGEVPDLRLIDSFDAELTQYEQSLLDGSPEDIYFFDCLKDERRPLAKAKVGNTRVFSVGPLNFTLMMRKYTAFFQAHCMSNATRSGSAVGINPHSQEWGDLYRRLTANSENFIAGDYGKWDKWVPFQLMMAVLNIVNDFYDDEGTPEATAREALFRQAFGAKRIAGRVVYQTSGGMPSGTPGTSIFNSLANEILFCYVFEKLRRVHAPTMLLTHYYSLISFTAYGDDHVLSVSDLVPWFNMITVSETFKAMDIEYTSADKSTDVFEEKYVPANELTYLKRKFRVIDDFFVLAPLEKTVICESILWAKSKENLESNMIATISSALLEIVHHGKEEYDWLDSILARACRLASLRMPFIGYSDTLHRIRGEGIPIEDGVSLCDPMQSLE